MQLYLKELISSQFLRFSLKERACVSVVTALWNNDSVSNYIKHLLRPSSKLCNKTWLYAEDTIFLHLDKLNLPETVKLQLKNLVQPLGQQLFHWTCVLKHIFLVSSIIDPYSYEIHILWTENGTINQAQTAEWIIHHNPDKNDLCSSLGTVFGISSVPQSVTCDRICRSNGSLHFALVAHHYPAYGCGYAKTIKCVPLVMVYLQRMVPNLEEQRINDFDSQCGEGFLFLVSALSASEFETFMVQNAVCILISLFEWPHQSFFMPIARRLLCHLTNHQIMQLVTALAARSSRFDKSYVHKDLIKEFLLCSSAAFKEHLERERSDLVTALLEDQNAPSIIDIINEYPSASRD